MSGNKKGGIKAKKTMLKRYGRDYYRRIGLKGGNPLLIAIRNKKNDG